MLKLTSEKTNSQNMSDIQRIRNLTDDSSLGSFKNEVIVILEKLKMNFIIHTIILGIGK